MTNTIQIKLSPKITNFFAENQNAKIYILYGGRMSGKTYSTAKIILYQMLYSGTDALVIRKVSDTMERGIHKEIKDKIIEKDDFLREHFEVLSNQFRVREDSIFAKRHGRRPCMQFNGLDGRGEGLKGLGAYGYLLVDEATELTEDQAMILRGTLIRNKGLVSYYCFNPKKPTDWIYDTFVTNYEKAKEAYGDSLAVLKVNWYDNTLLTQEAIDEIKIHKQILRYETYQHHYEGELAIDTDGALFTKEDIENATNHNLHGLTTEEIRKKLDYVVIGVDPAVSTGEASDKTGIIVAGLNKQEQVFYILEDATGKHTPFEWASRVEYLWNKWKANYVVAEGNQGGNLIKDNLLNMQTKMFIDMVHARFGKITRAEPIAALYQQKIVKHIRYYDYNKRDGNCLGDLETQMMTYTPFVKNAKSPDNMDAMVWALTKLLPMKNTIRYDAFQSFGF